MRQEQSAPDAPAALESTAPDSLAAALDSAAAAAEPFFSMPTGPALYLLIASAAAALALGIWIARPLPGQLRENAEELMVSGLGRRARVRRRFTPAAWLKRNISAHREPRQITIKRPKRR